MPSSDTDDLERPAAPRRNGWKPAIKLVLTVLVLVMAGRHVAKTWAEIEAKGRSISFDFVALSASMFVYVAGLAACGIYFGRVLKASTTPIRLIHATRGYLISHLGKYVPGKALVVVMRVALVRPYGARAATAAIATFYETLVMMAAGGIVATVGFLMAPSGGVELAAFGLSIRPPFWFLSLGAAVAFLIVVEPRVFPILARRATSLLKGVGPDALPRFTFGLLVEGLAVCGVAWILLGISQVLVVRAIGVEVPASIVPAVIASVALATVVGFAVPISPGGLGVREWVLWTALGASIDQDLAVVAALTLRLVWFAGEAIASAAVFAIRPPSGVPLAPQQVTGPLST